MKLKEFLPEVMHEILPDFFSTFEKSKETKADCENCSKCLVPGDKVDYKSDPENVTKCCNHHPSLPNFLIGAILSDTSGAYFKVQNVILERIHLKEGVTPFGLFPDENYLKSISEFKKSFEHKVNSNITCPFYDKQKLGCGIWKFRPNSCASFYCDSVDGLTGLNFWSEVRSYLGKFENKLTSYLVTSLINRKGLTLANEGNFHDKLWSSWSGKEVDFYKECFNLFGSLDQEFFKAQEKSPRPIVKIQKSHP